MYYFWVYFSYFEKRPLILMHGNQNSKDYKKLLEYHLLDQGTIAYGEQQNFQQDTCSIHVSKLSKNWFATKNVNLMEWPSRALDMNPVENLRMLLARQVYYNARQFGSLGELREAIFEEQEKLGDEVLHAHIDSMQRHCIAAVASQGAETKY